MQPQSTSTGRGATPWWYGFAGALLVGSIVAVVVLSSGNRTTHFTQLRARGLARVGEGDVDSVLELKRGTYSIVYRSDTLTARHKVPTARFSVRGGPFDKVRSVTVHNNPSDAEIDLASAGYRYGSTTTDPYGSLAATDPFGPSTTVDPSATGPSTSPTSYSSGYYGTTTGQAEVATFRVTDSGQYRIRGSLTGKPDQADPPDPEGVVALYPYRLANQVDAVAGGVFGFLGRLGLSILIGVAGVGLSLAVALVTASSRSKGRRPAVAVGGWRPPPQGAWTGSTPGWQPGPPPVRPGPAPGPPGAGWPPAGPPPAGPPPAGSPPALDWPPAASPPAPDGPRWPPPEPPRSR